MTTNPKPTPYRFNSPDTISVSSPLHAPVVSAHMLADLMEHRLEVKKGRRLARCFFAARCLGLTKEHQLHKREPGIDPKRNLPLSRIVLIRDSDYYSWRNGVAAAPVSRKIADILQVNPVWLDLGEGRPENLIVETAMRKLEQRISLAVSGWALLAIIEQFQVPSSVALQPALAEALGVAPARGMFGCEWLTNIDRAYGAAFDDTSRIETAVRTLTDFSALHFAARSALDEARLVSKNLALIPASHPFPDEKHLFMVYVNSVRCAVDLFQQSAEQAEPFIQDRSTEIIGYGHPDYVTRHCEFKQRYQALVLNRTPLSTSLT